MAMHTEYFDGDSTEKVLAVVLCPTSYGKSIYVNIPTIGKDRRTDGGARDMSSTTVEFEGDIYDYERDDYVMLTFEPSRYGDFHKLIRVEKAAFTDPLGSDEPKFPNTDIPITCPSCGKDACAVVKTEYNSMTGGKVNPTAEQCEIDPDNRGAWFDFSGEMTFVHGL